MAATTASMRRDRSVATYRFCQWPGLPGSQNAIARGERPTQNPVTTDETSPQVAIASTGQARNLAEFC